MQTSASRPTVLLIAPHGSYRTTEFLAAAKELDVEILIASQGEHSIVGSYARGLHIDFDDRDAALKKILDEGHRRPFAGIIGTDDGTIELAARAARRLGLPHNPPHAVRIARRKDRARACLARAGVPVPRHWRIDLAASLAVQAEAVRFPCVLKPLALSASRGVIRADDQDGFLRACARIGRIVAAESDPQERRFVLAEEFIPGIEVAVEGMLTDGRLEILAVFDKPDPLDGPYFEETYYVTPARLPPGTRARVRRAVSAACDAYGLRAGPVHAECRINDRGVWILEIAARTIGGLCARLLRFGTGYGLEELVLAQAMNRKLPTDPRPGAGGVLMIPIQQGGILRRVEGLEAAQKTPFVEEVRIQVREGYELVSLPEGSSYLGFIFARAPTAEQAEAALRAAHACLDVVVAPLFRVAPGYGVADAIPV